MRSVSVPLCIGVVLLSVACNKSETAVAGSGKVVITLNCESAGATIGVHPWRVAMASRDGQIEWSLAGRDLSVTITPKDPAQWPFEAPPPIVVDARPGIGKGLKDSAGGVYKYNVTGVCGASGTAPDTVVLDPDMIIPKK